MAFSSVLRAMRPLPFSAAFSDWRRSKNATKGIVQAVPLAFGNALGDRQKLSACVIREFNLVREAAGQAGVRRQEQRHLLAVPGQDHHQVIAVVLNTLYQGVNGFQPKAVLAAAVQAVCFINEQSAAQSALDHLVGQRSRVADIAAHQVGTGHFHQLAAAQCADGFQILGQNACRGCR